MRKAFNFYRSYFETAEHLSDKDYVVFMKAITHMQFYGVQPDISKMSAMAKLAWTGVKHSIESQLAGYESKTGQKLTPCQPPSVGGSVGGTVGGTEPPSVQVQVQGEGKDITCNSDECAHEFEMFWDTYGKKISRKHAEAAFRRLTKKDRAAMFEALPGFVAAHPDLRYRPHPTTFLRGRRWEDEITPPGSNSQPKFTL